MAVKFIEPGGDAEFGIGLWDAPGQANPVVATDFLHGSHVKSFKYATSVATSCGKHTVFQDAGARMSFYMYINALPAATASIADVLGASYGAGLLVLRITTAGVMQLFSSGIQLGSNGNTIATGGYHRISFAYTITSTTVYTFKAWIDGVLSLNVSNTGTLAGTGSADLFLGNISGDTTLDMRTSDHYIDDSSSLTDTGDVWVTAKRPNANGTNVQFTTQIGAGGSGYGTGHSPQVNERANSDTNGWSISTTTVKTEEYNIEGKSVGDIDISAATIIDYMGWIRASEASTANSPVTHIIVNGISTAKTLTTAAAVYEQMAGSSTYPAGSGTDIGMDGQYTTTAHLFSLFECGIVVAYTPASASLPPGLKTYEQAVKRAGTY